ncbi:hypothetical protein [Brevundimonas faecalis]|uniref:Uncharacterized protein n=1 Tax=Brevundimonas faecalis TaxID=947378 RepID=A0ABV2RFP0_9CAUL
MKRLLPLLGTALVAMAGVAAAADDLPARWRGTGPPVVTAAPGPCPALGGSYGVEARPEGRDNAAGRLDRILSYELGLTDAFGDGAPAAPAVTFAEHEGGWRIETAQGQQILALAPNQDVPLDPDRFRNGVRRSGCAGGRLWIAVSSVRTQYESQTMARSLGALSTAPNGDLILWVKTERRHYALLPWPSVKREETRLRFPRISS